MVLQPGRLSVKAVEIEKVKYYSLFGSDESN